jgi:N-acetylneuraminic acid mutarotase
MSEDRQESREISLGLLLACAPPITLVVAGILFLIGAVQPGFEGFWWVVVGFIVGVVGSFAAVPGLVLAVQAFRRRQQLGHSCLSWIALIANVAVVLLVLVPGLVVLARERRRHSVFDSSWSQCAQLRTARYGSAAAVVGGSIIVIGGQSGSQACYGTDDCVAVGAVEKYSPNSNSWSAGVAMPTARWDLGAAALGGRVYAVGGRRRAWVGGGRALRTVEVYTPATDRWSVAAPLLQPVDRAVVVALDGKLYVIGGAQAPYAELKTVQIYEPKTDSWSMGPPLPEARAGAAGVATDHTIYVVGGSGDLGVRGTAFAYTPEVGKTPAAWRRVSSMPTARDGLCVAAVDGRLVAAGGGRTGSSAVPTSTVEVYSVAFGRWTTGPPLPFVFLGEAPAGCVEIGGTVYTISVDAELYSLRFDGA